MEAAVVGQATALTVPQLPFEKSAFSDDRLFRAVPLVCESLLIPFDGSRQVRRLLGSVFLPASNAGARYFCVPD